MGAGPMFAAGHSKYGPDDVRAFYESFGRLHHVVRNEDLAAVIPLALVSCGLPESLSAAATDRAWDDTLREATAEPAIAPAASSLTTLISQRLRVDSPQLVPNARFLLYANTDLTNSGESMKEKGHGLGLEIADIEWCNRQWVPDEPMWTDRPGQSALRSRPGRPATDRHRDV